MFFFSAFRELFDAPPYYRWQYRILAGILFAGFLAWLIGAALLDAGGAAAIRLIWRDDPATAMTIGWDQRSGNNPVVCYGTEDHGRDWESYPLRAAPDREVDYLEMHNCFARLRNLQPDTAYWFVIKDSTGVSGRYWFRTAPDRPQPFTLISGGDIRSWPESGPAKNANRMAARLRPLGILFAGDFTTNGDEPFHDNADEWRWWFEDWALTVSPDGRMYPIMPVMGNHEKTNAVLHYLFDTPRPENYYALSFGGNMLRVYALNSFLDMAPGQQEWLRQDLAAHRDVTFKAAMHHTPMVPHTSKKRRYTETYDAWAELFYAYGVNLVIEGHSHVHKITYPVRPAQGPEAYQGFVTDFARGMVFIGEGSWSSRPRVLDDRKPWTLTQGRFYQFKWLHFYPDHFEIRTVLTQNPKAVTPVLEKDVFAVPNGLELAEDPTYGTVVRYPFTQNSTARAIRYE